MGLARGSLMQAVIATRAHKNGVDLGENMTSQTASRYRRPTDLGCCTIYEGMYGATTNASVRTYRFSLLNCASSTAFRFPLRSTATDSLEGCAVAARTATIRPFSSIEGCTVDSMSQFSNDRCACVVTVWHGMVSTAHTIRICRLLTHSDATSPAAEGSPSRSRHQLGPRSFRWIC